MRKHLLWVAAALFCGLAYGGEVTDGDDTNGPGQLRTEIGAANPGETITFSPASRPRTWIMLPR